MWCQQEEVETGDWARLGCCNIT